LYIIAIIVAMAIACLASIAILVGSMAALYGLDWYRSKRRQNRRLAKKSVVEGHVTTEAEQQPVVEQVA
jgi:hypothetical protein